MKQKTRNSGNSKINNNDSKQNMSIKKMRRQIVASFLF